MNDKIKVLEEENARNFLQEIYDDLDKEEAIKKKYLDCLYGLLESNKSANSEDIETFRSLCSDITGYTVK